MPCVSILQAARNFFYIVLMFSAAILFRRVLASVLFASACSILEQLLLFNAAMMEMMFHEAANCLSNYATTVAAFVKSRRDSKLVAFVCHMGNGAGI